VFYTNSQQWGIAQNPSSGEVSAATTTVPPLPGALVPVQQAPAQSVMPIYELTALPGQTQQSFVLLQPFVPFSNGDKQNLTAFMTAASDPDDYGQLTVFHDPSRPDRRWALPCLHGGHDQQRHFRRDHAPQPTWLQGCPGQRHHGRHRPIVGLRTNPFMSKVQQMVSLA